MEYISSLDCISLYKFNNANLCYVTGFNGSIDREGFQEALYAIDIGQNDLSGAFGGNLTYDEVIAKIPIFISQIENAIKASLSFDSIQLTNSL